MEGEILQSIWDTMGDGIIVANENGRIVLANAAAKQLYGADIDVTPLSEWPERFGLYLPDAQTLYDGDQLPLARAIRGEVVDLEEIFVRPAGAPEGFWVAVNARPWRDRDGVIRGAFADLRDMTRLKRTEEALRKERDWVSGILDTSAALIAAFDREQRVVHFNRACERMTGYSSEEVKDRVVWEMLVPPEETGGVRSLFDELKDAPLSREHENHWMSRDGARRLIAWTYSPLLNAEGGLEYVVSTGVDVTEHRLLEARSRQAQKLEAVGSLAGGIAHDFNNLLTVISGYNHMVLDELPPDNPSRSAAEEVQKAAERAAALTNQLLSFSRRQVTQPKVLDLNEVVLHTEKMLRRVIGEDIELIHSLAPDLSRVKADAGGLEQIIMNLAANARDALPDGGRLVIETANTGSGGIDGLEATSGAESYAMLMVSDNGCGMAPETQAHIFEPFFTTKQQGKGAGLGLATVYGIVAQSNGHILVDSKPDQGTTVRIYFPALAVAVEEEEPAAVAQGSLRGTETILLVEDETGVRKLVEKTLGQKGYTVLPASNGWEALQLQEQHQGPIELLIADIVVPQMNGQELAARLGLLRPETRVLFMSGYTDKAIILEGVLSSGTAFIKKPFTPDALAAKVREVLDNSKAKRAG
jgi:PAS domain S-box-containing protein